jgi:hypothetical protein
LQVTVKVNVVDLPAAGTLGSVTAMLPLVERTVLAQPSPVPPPDATQLLAGLDDDQFSITAW